MEATRLDDVWMLRQIFYGTGRLIGVTRPLLVRYVRIGRTKWCLGKRVSWMREPHFRFDYSRKLQQR